MIKTNNTVFPQRRCGRRTLRWLIALCLTSAGPASWAGTYIFAGEGNGVDLIAHPSGYTGVGGTLNVGVCIDPNSVHANELAIPVQNIISVWNALQPVHGNVDFNVIDNNQGDVESVLLHELGHCTGLAHVNLASESGLSGGNQNYTKSTDGTNNVFDIAPGGDGVIGSADDQRGDDVNMHWFNPYNDPFMIPIPTPVDTRLYLRDPFGAGSPLGAGEWVVNADRDVSVALGYPMSESVMQQGSYFGEVQRELVSDDVSTILLAASGVDETAGTGDDYQMVLNYQGIGGSDCDITISFDDSQTGFAVCQVSGRFINSDHIRITTGNIYLNSGYNWYFNDQLLNAANQPPVAVDDSAGVDEDASVIIDVLANDSDPDNDVLSVASVGSAANGSTVINADDTITFTPAADFHGTVGFNYVLSDGNGGTDNGLVNVTVNAVNDAPVAGDDSAETEQGTPVTIAVLANDSDIDGPGLSVSAVGQGSNGSVGHDGSSVTYTPNPAFSGTDNFTYTVSDGEKSDTATVSVTVTAPNQPPTAAFSSQCSGLTCGFDASAASDPDGNIVGYNWNFGDGSTGNGATPSHTYAAAGDYTVSLTVTDDDGATAAASAVVTTTAAPDPAAADWNTVQGTVSGSYSDTRTQGGGVQSISETHSGGKPSARSDGLQHIWRFDLSGGNHIFNVSAYATFPNGDADSGFRFEWSNSANGGWQPLLTIDTTAANGYRSADIGSGVAGTVYVRVIDNDSTQGNTTLSTLTVDHMFFDGGTPPTAPPAVATNPNPADDAVGVAVDVDLGWSAGTGAESHSVYFGTDPNNLPLVSSGQSNTRYDPGALTTVTTYYWRVDETNAIGTTTGTTWSFTTSPNAGPSELRVSSIVLTTVNAGKGSKRGQAVVTVTDDFGNAIDNVSVSGDFSGGFNETSLSASTNANGEATVTTSGSVKGGVSFTFCVTGIGASALPYNPPVQDCASF